MSYLLSCTLSAITDQMSSGIQKVREKDQCWFGSMTKCRLSRVTWSDQVLLADPEERRSFMDMRLLLVRGDMGDAESLPASPRAGLSPRRISRQEPFNYRQVRHYDLCQTAGECTEQDCRLEPRSPRRWLAPGGAAQWFLGIELAPHRSSGTEG